MSDKKSYESLGVYGNKYVANTAHTGEKLTKLNPGIYTIHFDMQRQIFWFQDFNAIADNILDLPSEEYQRITNEMKFFLTPQVRQRFKDMGFIYKRSALLFGEPGTGKTCIVNRISKDVIKMGGIVIYNNNPALLKMAFEVLSDLQPDTLTMAVFEEFDSIAAKHEEELLTLLDGEVQKENVMYLATTNYLNKVPKRLYRPGRFSSVIEVHFPIPEARRQYFVSKLGSDFKDLELYVKKTANLSIDELKEVVQAVEILGGDLDKTVARLIETRTHDEVMPKNSRGSAMRELFGSRNNDDDNEDVFEDDDSDY